MALFGMYWQMSAYWHKTVRDVLALTLLILGQAKVGGPNRFPFKDLVEDLEKALQEFGLPRQSLHPESPFWHLQDDDFWVVENKTEIPISEGTSEPGKKVLLEHNAVAIVPAPAWSAIETDLPLIENLTTMIVNKFWPDHSVHKRIREFFGLTK